jgi:hypothetical protein
MGQLDREKSFGKDRSKYFWCLHCERAYERTQFRLVGKLQMCPYAGCSGDTVMDAWEWDEIRRFHAAYPKVPRHGVHYPMYRSEKTIEHEFGRYRRASRQEGGLMTQANATFVLNLSKQRLNDLVRTGRLHWHPFFNTKFLSCREIAEFKAVKRKAGRPAGKGKTGNGNETDSAE